LLTSDAVAELKTTWETLVNDIEFGTAVTEAKDLYDSFDASTAIFNFEDLQLAISTA
jgi:hypothetical protein